MKSYLSSLSPLHEKDEEQEPFFVEDHEDPYLPEPPKNTPHIGPEKTVLAEGVVITGTLSATGDMDIFGTVNGNVETKGSLLLAGTVEGDICARELHFSKANLHGNITATELVVLEDNSNISGDIVTRDFILDSKLQGNVKATGAVQLKKMAALTGNVEAGALEVAKGALINGSITIKK